MLELLETITMRVEDAAFLLGVSKDALYDALSRDERTIPHYRVGRVIKILSQPFLSRLGLH